MKKLVEIKQEIIMCEQCGEPILNEIKIIETDEYLCRKCQVEIIFKRNSCGDIFYKTMES